MSSFDRLPVVQAGGRAGAVGPVRAAWAMPCPSTCVLAFMAAFSLSGCGLAEIESARVEAEAIGGEVAAFRELAPKPGLSVVRVVENRPYVGFERVEADARLGLPDKFRESDAVTLPLAGAERAAVFAARIEAAAGLAVQLGRVAAVAEGGEGKGGAFTEALGDRLAPGGGIWTGALDVLLDAWTEAHGYEWEYDEAAARIDIVRSRSVVYQLHALAGEQTYEVSSSTEDQAGDDEAASQTKQSIDTSASFDPWPEIETQLLALVSPATRVSVSPSSASVLVSGLPVDVARVGSYLGYLNREVLRPVTLSVHVYSVRRSRGADYELGLSVVIERLLGSPLQLGAGADSVAVIKPGVVGEDTFSAAVDAMNQAGTASRVLSADIPSLNGKPAQFFELFNEAYLREQRTTISDGVAQTELVPGRVSSGFAVSYLPRITGPGEVLVRLFASLQDRPVFTVFTSANQSIQLPAFGSRAIQVTQKIGRGETLLVTGFSDRSVSAESSGTFWADLPLPSGGRAFAETRAEQVLLITADIGAPLGVSAIHGASF